MSHGERPELERSGPLGLSFSARLREGRRLCFSMSSRAPNFSVLKSVHGWTGYPFDRARRWLSCSQPVHGLRSHAATGMVHCLVSCATRIPCCQKWLVSSFFFLFFSVHFCVWSQPVLLPSLLLPCSTSSSATLTRSPAALCPR